MLYSLSHYLKPTRHMLRPLHNASLSDISTPLNISDISAPTQPNNAIIGICILKSPRFQTNRLRTTPIKQQINDRPSLLFSTTPLKPRRNGQLFSKTQGAQHKQNRTNRSQPPTQNHTKNTTQRPSPSKRASSRSPQSKRHHHITPTPLSGKKNKRFKTLSTAFSNSFVQTYNISVKQGENDSIFV